MPAKKEPVPCSLEGCKRNALCKGYCDMHYRRLLLKGSVHDRGSRKVDLGDEIERFHQKYIVQDDGCWIWQAAKNANSKGVLYGKFTANGNKTMSAHRFSYSRFIEPISPGGYVCHKCDTPLCVNPNHLFQSDHSGNMRDMVEKGRSHTGNGGDANASKLTDAQAAEIRLLDLPQRKIAEMYGVSQVCISRIKRGVTYPCR